MNEPMTVLLDVSAVLLPARVSFTSVLLLMAGCGFNINGIEAGPSGLMNPRRQILLPLLFYWPYPGTLAAAFQSAFYRGFVPAGRLFAKLQSMGMLGTLLPVRIGRAGVAAVVVRAIVWALGGGGE